MRLNVGQGKKQNPGKSLFANDPGANIKLPREDSNL